MFKPMATLVMLGSVAGTAAAQSSVTLYGLVDLSVLYARSGDLSPLAGNNTTRLADGTVFGPGSRWGLRVNEDLGSGLSARAVLEGGFFADTGMLAQGGRGFGRQAFVALNSTAVGELRLGRQYTLLDETLAQSNALGNTTVLNPGGVTTFGTGTLPTFIDQPRVDNAVQYLSPTIGGFQLQAMIAPGEKVNDRYQAIKGSYTAGPLNLYAAYEWSKALTVPPGGDSTVNKIFQLSANYNFDVFTLYGGYQKGKDLAMGVGLQVGTLELPGLTGPVTDSESYTVSVKVPMGAWAVMPIYNHAKYSNSSGDVDYGKYGVAATYNLSKLTLLYGAVALSHGDLDEFVNDKRAIQIGLRKAF